MNLMKPSVRLAFCVGVAFSCAPAPRFTVEVDPSTVPSVISTDDLDPFKIFPLDVRVINSSKEVQEFSYSTCGAYYNFVIYPETFWVLGSPCHGGDRHIVRTLGPGEDFKERVPIHLYVKDPIGLHRFKLGFFVRTGCDTLRSEYGRHVRCRNQAYWSDLVTIRTEP